LLEVIGFYAPPIFSPPQPAPLPLPPLGSPWWLSPPIFPDHEAAQPAPQPAAPAPPPGMANGVVRATATGVPVVGGLLKRMDAATNAALAPLLNPLFDPKDQLTEPGFSGRYAHSLSDQEIADQRFAADHPVLNTTANLAGGVASMAPVVRAVPWAFGVGKALPTTVARSGLTGAGLGGADAAVRGQDIPQGAAVGGVLGAVLPAAGRAAARVFGPSTRAPAVGADPEAADRSTSAPSAEGLPQLRQEYVYKVRALAGKADQMRAEGHSAEEIARTLSADRRALGEQYKALTPADELARIHERNINKYGDKLGPTIDWYRNAGRSWEQIIEAASRPGGKDLGEGY